MMVGYHRGSMGTWLDDYNVSPAVRTKLGKMNDEWAEIDRRLAAEPTPAERATMLGRLDEIEFEIDETIRGGKGKSATAS